MVFWCCVTGCNNSNKQERMYSFPKEVEATKKWLRLIGRNELINVDISKVRKNYRVCATHFDSSAKFISHHNRTDLKFNSVPTLHLPALRRVPACLTIPVSTLGRHNLSVRTVQLQHNFCSLAIHSNALNNCTSGLLCNPKIKQISNNIITRSVTKFSLRKGKRKSVKTVLKRFYRLRWGGWIRTKCGRHKKLWKKSPQRKRRLRQHVLCNAQQCTLLDKMVTNFWRKPKYYVDDPYEPYHTREEYRTTYTKPRPYYPNE